VIFGLIGETFSETFLGVLHGVKRGCSGVLVSEVFDKMFDSGRKGGGKAARKYPSRSFGIAKHILKRNCGRELG
jgi:hypothetical protein